jgi:hypothetical protein
VSDQNGLTKWVRFADRSGYWGLVLTVGTVVTGFGLGVLVALSGGPLRFLGDGFGGGWGIPSLALLLAAVLGLPALLAAIFDLIRGRWAGATRLLLFLGPLLVGFGFDFIAHLVDPCFNGLWTIRSTLGEIPLCERFGLELNIHTRFHLLLHAAGAMPLAGLFWLALQKWYPSILPARTRTKSVQQAALGGGKPNATRT